MKGSAFSDASSAAALTKKSVPPTAVFKFETGGFAVKGVGWRHYVKLEIVETATSQVTRIEGHPAGLQWLSADLSYHLARWRDWWDGADNVTDGKNRGFHARAGG